MMDTDTTLEGPYTLDADLGEAMITDDQPQGGAFATLREQARAQHAHARSERTLDLDIPGVKSLVARYRVLSYDALAKIAKVVGADKRDRADLYGQCSTLVQACVGVYGRIDNELVPLADGVDDGDPSPVRYDARLCEFLGLDPGPRPTAISCLLALIPDIRVPGHYFEYMEWHSGASADAEDALVGESISASR